MKKILAFVAVLLPVMVFAQSASMMAMAQAELQKRGLNETEVRTRLLEEGIDVDNISPTEYVNYQDRVLTILDKMQAEKSSADANAAVTGIEIACCGDERLEVMVKAIEFVRTVLKDQCCEVND